MPSVALFRGLAVVVVAAALLVAATGIGGLHFNSHYSVYFDRDDPRLVQHRAISQTYSRSDAVIVILASDERDLLTADQYIALEDLTATLAGLPHATRAVSIASLGIAGDLSTADDAIIPTLEQLRAHDRAVGLLLSADARFAVIRAEFQLPDTGPEAVLRTLRDVRQAVETRIAGLPITPHYTGPLALNEAYVNVVRHDLATIVPVLLVVIALLLAVLLGSIRAAMTVLPVGVVSVAAAFGIAGWFNAELAAINSFVPVIILSISLAACVHMALSFGHYRGRGADPAEAALKAFKFNLLPLSLASATTALGFLGLTFSPSPPIRVVGYVVATGVAMSFILCMTLLPALQAWLDPWRQADQRKQRFFDSLGAFVRDRRATIIGVFIVLAVPAVLLVARNVISDNVFEYFPDSHPFSRDTLLLEEHFSGVNEVLYSLDTDRQNGLFRAAAIEAVDTFAAWLRQQPEVIRATSIADIKELAEARADGRLQERLSRYERIAEERNAFDPLLAQEVSRDYSAALVSVYLRQMDSAHLAAFDQRVNHWVGAQLADIKLTGGGPALIFAYLGEHNIRGMLVALTAALLLAALVLGVVLRSIRVAVIGLACNVLPVLLVYSVWAVVNGRISLGAAVVMGMILGIVIDDTIYLLSTYRRGLARNRVDPVAYALRRVGPALVTTTIILSAGLSIGLLSDFGPIWSMSALSVAIIAVALITDLLLLPAMLPVPPGVAGISGRDND